jgi:thioredoxin 2
MQRDDSLIIECPHCRTGNRVLSARFNEAPVCGSCQRELLSGAPLTLNDENFLPVIEASARPVVVDFWASWCAPCKMFAPVFSAAAARTPAVLFAKLDTDANTRITSRYVIRNIPTTALFRHGQLAERVSGALPQKQFDAWLRSALT